MKWQKVKNKNKLFLLNMVYLSYRFVDLNEENSNIYYVSIWPTENCQNEQFGSNPNPNLFTPNPFIIGLYDSS
jgi:hypothetical protein